MRRDRYRAVMKALSDQMTAASEDLEFERAARLRDRIRALSSVSQEQSINPQTLEEADVFAVHCEGDITQIFFQLGNPLEKLLGATTFTRKVILDLEQVNFLDSSGLSWLVACHKRFQQQKGRMVLCAIPPRILQVLQFCRMDRLFTTTEDEAAAHKCLQGDQP